LVMIGPSVSVYISVSETTARHPDRHLLRARLMPENLRALGH
jgi:hypothetical protein